MEELVQMSSSSDDEEYSSLAEEVPFIAGLVLLGFLCLRNVINKELPEQVVVLYSPLL